MKLRLPLSACNIITVCIVLVLTHAANAVVLVSDTFSDDGTLNGSTPDIGAAWQATTGSAASIASGGVLAVSSTAAQTSVIDLGAGFINANPGIYELSADLLLPAGSSTNWIGIGFVINPSINGHMATSTSAAGLNPNGGANGGSPWMFLRQNGGVNVYRGPGTASPASSIASTFASGSIHTMKLVLDTTATNWTIDAYVDGGQLDLNGVAAGNSSVFTTNPADLRYVGFSQNGVNFGTITLDNFTLSYTVPEPSASLAALACGAFVLLNRRRRSAQR